MSSEADNTLEEGGSGFTLTDIFGVLRRRWLLVAACIVAVGAFAGLIALSLPTVYEASATIQIDPRKKTIVNVENVIADLRADQATVESEVEVLQSKTLALRVIEALDLRNHPEFNRKSSLGKIFESFGFGGVDATQVQRRHEDSDGVVLGSNDNTPERMLQRDAVVTAFSRRLKVARVRNTLHIEVKISAGDPELAARMANALVEIYLKEQVAAKVKATGQATELVEQKLEGLRQKVYEAERKVTAFKAQHNIFDAEGQPLAEKQLARLMEQTVLASNATAEAKAKYLQAQQMLRKGVPKSSIAEVLGSLTIRTFKEHHARATKREAELLTRYGPRHPEMAKARAEVADIEAQIARETDMVIANLETDYRVAERREQSLSASLSALKDQQVISTEAGVQLRELEREAATSKQIFEAFLSRYKQIAETQDLQVADSRIVERADIPLASASPKRGRFIFVGAMLGGLFGCGLALLIEFMMPALRRPDEIEEVLGLPHLASVPHLKRQSDGLGDPESAMRAVVTVPNGVFAQAVAAARLAIDRRRSDPEPRVILVTSALGSEGKSLIAASLAYQLAQAGVRTLLIDADLRRSKLSQQLGLERSPGVLDAVIGGQPFEGFLLRDSTTGLAVLPAGVTGNVHISAAEAVSAPGFGQRIVRLKTYFDTIIIDAPPLIPVVDGRILADDADQIVLVTTWGKTPRQLVRRAMHLLSNNATKLIGVIINQVDALEHARAAGAPAEKDRRQGKVPPAGQREAA